ncbi:MAG: aminotransferase class V-fold PLP-dependent enzyme [Candidatus Aminicenantes bacterium]|nr:aminotransferase class V-fold PLP-dependent enzyme [Candidatus Aminicenantes bacterium]
MTDYTMAYIRSQIIGSDTVFETPFGERNIFYADYTASGRGLAFIEDKMNNILKSYGNSHTEDDYTGVSTTHLLHRAEDRIKSLVNAGPEGKIIFTGSGATGALERLQKIIGIYQPPVTRERMSHCMSRLSEGISPSRFNEIIEKFCPVVFVGPYEHHSNDLMWRESLAKVEVIRLSRTGEIDLEDLETRLADPCHASRNRFASFSAGSNITGLKTDVYEIARICHRHHALVFFDFAAIAPYEEINMNRDPESRFDAIFFSPHKFLGGPGTSGILIFNQRIYRQDLSPTTAGGGTVDYVGFTCHDFSREIETREKPGTPGILQAIKSALVMDLKDKIGVPAIKAFEQKSLDLFFSTLKDHPGFHFLGNLDLSKRVPIISFNIRHEDRILHPKFVTKLLNDLFGIQSRAGCSCAGPYGHILLDIDDARSQEFREVIQQGLNGLKPGWVRINLHFSFSGADIQFLIRALEFIADRGHLFLQQYVFYIHSGEWRFEGFQGPEFPLEIDHSFEPPVIENQPLEVLRESYFQQAQKQAEALKNQPSEPYAVDVPEIEKLKYFYYVKVDRSPAGFLSCCTV